MYLFSISYNKYVLLIKNTDCVCVRCAYLDSFRIEAAAYVFTGQTFMIFIDYI